MTPNKQQPISLEGMDGLRKQIQEIVDQITVTVVYKVNAIPDIAIGTRTATDQIMSLIRPFVSTKEREADTVNRFEVINHLSDGSGREVVVWKDEPFKVKYSLQDDGRTLKVFLTDVAHLNAKEKEV